MQVARGLCGHTSESQMKRVHQTDIYAPINACWGPEFLVTRVNNLNEQITLVSLQHIMLPNMISHKPPF